MSSIAVLLWVVSSLAWPNIQWEERSGRSFQLDHKEPRE